MSPAHSPGAIEYNDCISAEKEEPYNEYPGYDTKHSNSGALVMHGIWEIWCTNSLPSLPGPLWPGVVALDSVLSMVQIDLF